MFCAPYDLALAPARPIYGRWGRWLPAGQGQVSLRRGLYIGARPVDLRPRNSEQLRDHQAGRGLRKGLRRRTS
ncbi:hypothetical protein KCP76_06680 [Salmonella enterica subsp. enterica serovar Weltevreden]|nr:hypothetical protein KCP76_06680 [Salmonella enterica subsp. enterica serovar Weltevreden]